MPQAPRVTVRLGATARRLPATKAFAAILGLAALVAGPGALAVSPSPAPPAESLVPASTPRPDPTGIPVPSPFGTPFFDGLVTGDEQPFELSSLLGHPTFVYFGYTHCPDVCPATLGELFQVFEAVPEARAVFVTIDPERDTPAFLSEWAEYLPAQLTPVTGAPMAIRAVADAWGARYAKVETTSANGYGMSHTAEVYLVDPAGNLVARYPFGTPAQTFIDDLTGSTG